MIPVLVVLAAVGWLAAHRFWHLNRLHVQAYQRAMDGWQQFVDLTVALSQREELLRSVIREVRAQPTVTPWDRRN